MLPATAGADKREFTVRRREPIAAFDVVREEPASISVVVQDVLSEPHPLDAKSVKALRGGKSDHDGYLRPRTTDCLDLHVTMGSIDRAMRIYDALIKALEERGYPVEIQKYKRENFAEPQHRTIECRACRAYVQNRSRYDRASSPVIPIQILRVLSTIWQYDVPALLMAGQACVLYGAAEYSRDLDLPFDCGAGPSASLDGHS